MPGRYRNFRGVFTAGDFVGVFVTRPAGVLGNFSRRLPPVDFLAVRFAAADPFGGAVLIGERGFSDGVNGSFAGSFARKPEDLTHNS